MTVLLWSVGVLTVAVPVIFKPAAEVKVFPCATSALVALPNLSPSQHINTEEDSSNIFLALNVPASFNRLFPSSHDAVESAQ